LHVLVFLGKDGGGEGELGDLVAQVARTTGPMATQGTSWSSPPDTWFPSVSVTFL